MKLRNTIILFISLYIYSLGYAQIGDSLVYGVVSYQNPNNVYVKFASTQGISVGDTLFVERDGSLIPVLAVRHTSSISVVGESISDFLLNVSDTLVFRSRGLSRARDDHEVISEAVIQPELPVVPVPEEAESETPMTSLSANRESIRGRLSASFYSNVFNAPVNDIQRMRYTFSLQAKHLDDSKFSVETYVSFRHQLDDWKAEKVEMSRALRVYNLAVSYDVGERTIVSLGRKVNTHISNVGAIDGLQVEHTSGTLTFGGLAGSRPDHQDYGFNADLLQAGAFIAHRMRTGHGEIRNALALVEQRNGGMTDRRFAYFQHNSMPVKNISVFTSFEIDLYARPDSVAKNTFSVTGAYVSLQFRPTRKLTLFGSYDARKNVIYYETYRNFIDELIEQETRQGLRFRANYRPVKYLSIGSSVGYRFQKDHGSNSMNMYHYLTYSRVPWINASMTASATILENDYLHGIVYGVRMSRDVLKQKVYAQAEVRKVDYKYGNSEFALDQWIGGLNLSWRIKKRLSLGVDYEGIFVTERATHRMHLNIIQRF